MMRECALNGEFNQSLYSDMQDLTKKIKELNVQHKDALNDRTQNLGELADITDLCDRLVRVKEAVLNKQRENSLETTQPQFSSYIKMNLSLVCHILANLTSEKYTFQNSNFNDLEDLDAITHQNRLLAKEKEIEKAKEKENDKKEKENDKKNKKDDEPVKNTEKVENKNDNKRKRNIVSESHRPTIKTRRRDEDSNVSINVEDDVKEVKDDARKERSNPLSNLSALNKNAAKESVSNEEKIFLDKLNQMIRQGEEWKEQLTLLGLHGRKNSEVRTKKKSLVDLYDLYEMQCTLSKEFETAHLDNHLRMTQKLKIGECKKKVKDAMTEMGMQVPSKILGTRKVKNELEVHIVWALFEDDKDSQSWESVKELPDWFLKDHHKQIQGK